MRSSILILVFLSGFAFGETYNPPKGMREPMSIFVAPGTKIPIPKVLPTPVNTFAIEELFVPYVANIKKFYEKYNHERFTIGKLSVIKAETFNKITGMDSDAVGECSTGERIIRIGDWWRFGECQKEELITHEVGHCVFDMDHDVGGFMQPKMHSEEECKANLENLREHFFKNAKNYRVWQKEKDKAEKDYRNAVSDYLNQLEWVEE